MDFSVIFQLRTKKFWWMDVIFYFVISLLIATVLCYVIFLTKNNFQREDIKKETAVLQTVGTDQQKEYEINVVNYRNKINDFTVLFKNHEFASNIFSFLQAQTMPNIWFKQFNLDEKNNAVQLSGEADDMNAFSRQVATLENEDNKKYIKSIGTLSSSLGESARVEFNINLALNQNIFSYLSTMPSISETASPSGESLIQQGQAAPEGQTTQPPAGTESSEKLITSFHILLNPEVAGIVDETNYAVTLNVPYGTDLKNLTPSIVISSGATVSPASDAPQDFTNPVTYTVAAQDGSTQDYQVKVIAAAQPKAGKKTNQSGFIILIVVVLVVIIAMIAGVFFLYQKKLKNKI